MQGNELTGTLTATPDSQDQNTREISILQPFSFKNHQKGIFENLFEFQDSLTSATFNELVNDVSVQDYRHRMTVLIDQVSLVHEIQRENWIEQYWKDLTGNRKQSKKISTDGDNVDDQDVTFTHDKEDKEERSDKVAEASKDKRSSSKQVSKRQKSRALSELLKSEIREMYNRFLLEPMTEIQYDSEYWQQELQPKYDRQVLESLYSSQWNKRQLSTVELSELDMRRIENFERFWKSNELIAEYENNREEWQQKERDEERNRIETYRKMMDWIQKKKQFDEMVRLEEKNRREQTKHVNVFEFRMQVFKWRKWKRNLAILQRVKSQIYQCAIRVIEEYYSDYETFVSAPDLSMMSQSHLRLQRVNDPHWHVTRRVISSLIDFSSMPEMLAMWKICARLSEGIQHDPAEKGVIETNVQLITIRHITLDRKSIRSMISVHLTNFLVLIYLVQTMKREDIWSKLAVENQTMYRFIEHCMGAVVRSWNIDWKLALDKQCFTHDICQVIDSAIAQYRSHTQEHTRNGQKSPFLKLGIDVCENSFVNHLEVIHYYHSLKELLTASIDSSSEQDEDDNKDVDEYDLEMDLFVRTPLISLTSILKQLKEHSKQVTNAIVYQKLAQLSQLCNEEVDRSIKLQIGPSIHSGACVYSVQLMMELWNIMAQCCKLKLSLDSTSVTRYMKSIESMVDELVQRIDFNIRLLDNWINQLRGSTVPNNNHPS